MDDQYSIADAKNKLPSIIHSVETGRAVKLIRHGKTVAVLMSFKEYQRMSRKREGYWTALTAFRKQMGKEKLFITGEELEHLRDDFPGREPDLS